MPWHVARSAMAAHVTAAGLAISIGNTVPTVGTTRRTRPTTVRIGLIVIAESVEASRRTACRLRIAEPPEAIFMEDASPKRKATLRANMTTIDKGLPAVLNVVGACGRRAEIRATDTTLAISRSRARRSCGTRARTRPTAIDAELETISPSVSAAWRNACTAARIAHAIAWTCA